MKQLLTLHNLYLHPYMQWMQGTMQYKHWHRLPFSEGAAATFKCNTDLCNEGAMFLVHKYSPCRSSVTQKDSSPVTAHPWVQYQEADIMQWKWTFKLYVNLDPTSDRESGPQVPLWFLTSSRTWKRVYPIHILVSYFVFVHFFSKELKT